jgi:hypothetical protein
MRVFENGKYRDMTAEEIAEMESMQKELPAPQPTEAERLAALEQAGIERDAALMELAAILAGGV